MVFQDGQAYVNLEGPVRAPTVFDNLIHKGEMPVTIGIFINPGRSEHVYDQRGAQYVPLSDAYARFLLEEILPEVGKDYNLVDDAAGRAIGGMSDGGLAAFTAAWERPDAFSKVVSHIGSYNPASRRFRVSVPRSKDPRKPETHTRVSAGWIERPEPDRRKLDPREHEHGVRADVRPGTTIGSKWERAVTISFTAARSFLIRCDGSGATIRA